MPRQVSGGYQKVCRKRLGESKDVRPGSNASREINATERTEANGHGRKTPSSRSYGARSTDGATYCPARRIQSISHLAISIRYGVGSVEARPGLAPGIAHAETDTGSVVADEDGQWASEGNDRLPRAA